MTRAQIHRAAKEKDKLARTGKYGNIGINPHPGPSRNKSGDAGMTVGNMMQVGPHRRESQGRLPGAGGPGGKPYHL